DRTGLVWEVRPPLGPSDARAPARLWDDLAGTPEAAFRAVWLAAADPGAAAFLREKLQPAATPPPERLRALVADLDSPDFATREKAERDLLEVGRAARVATEAAHAATDSAEVRARLARVLKKWATGVPTAEEWRHKRAVLAAELAGTPEARELLKG